MKMRETSPRAETGENVGLQDLTPKVLANPSLITFPYLQRSRELTPFYSKN